MLTRTWCWLLGIVLAVFLQVPASSRPGPQQKFVGVWRLVSVETVRPNGEVIYPFYGKHPQGLIMYDASG